MQHKELTTLPYFKIERFDHKLIINDPIYKYLWRTLVQSFDTKLGWQIGLTISHAQYSLDKLDNKQ